MRLFRAFLTWQSIRLKTLSSAEKAYIETPKELKRIEGEKEIADVVGFISLKVK